MPIHRISTEDADHLRSMPQTRENVHIDDIGPYINVSSDESDSSEKKMQRMESVKNYSWESRFNKITSLINAALREHKGSI